MHEDTDCTMVHTTMGLCPQDLLLIIQNLYNNQFLICALSYRSYAHLIVDLGLFALSCRAFPSQPNPITNIQPFNKAYNSNIEKNQRQSNYVNQFESHVSVGGLLGITQLGQIFRKFWERNQSFVECAVENMSWSMKWTMQNSNKSQ